MKKKLFTLTIFLVFTIFVVDFLNVTKVSAYSDEPTQKNIIMDGKQNELYTISDSFSPSRLDGVDTHFFKIDDSSIGYDYYTLFLSINAKHPSFDNKYFIELYKFENGDYRNIIYSNDNAKVVSNKEIRIIPGDYKLVVSLDPNIPHYIYDFIYNIDFNFVRKQLTFSDYNINKCNETSNICYTDYLLNNMMIQVNEGETYYIHDVIRQFEKVEVETTNEHGTFKDVEYVTEGFVMTIETEKCRGIFMCNMIGRNFPTNTIRYIGYKITYMNLIPDTHIFTEYRQSIYTKVKVELTFNEMYEYQFDSHTLVRSSIESTKKLKMIASTTATVINKDKNPTSDLIQHVLDDDVNLHNLVISPEVKGAYLQYGQTVFSYLVGLIPEEYKISFYYDTWMLSYETIKILIDLYNDVKRFKDFNGPSYEELNEFNNSKDYLYANYVESKIYELKHKDINSNIADSIGFQIVISRTKDSINNTLNFNSPLIFYFEGGSDAIYIENILNWNYTNQDLDSPSLTVKNNEVDIPVKTNNYIENILSQFGATAKDGIFGDLTSSINYSHNININVPGKYPIEFTVKDFVGNTASITCYVNVVDITPPSVTLNGSKEIILSQNQAYIELGARITDQVDLNPQLIITGSVDTNVPGEYSITYKGIDNSGNMTSVVRKVTVVSNANPLSLSLLNAREYNYLYGITGAASYEIKTSNGTSLSKYSLVVGTYYIIIKNSSGTTIATRQLNVTSEPIGFEQLFIPKGSNPDNGYLLNGIIALDDKGKNLPINATVVNRSKLNFEVAGSYNIDVKICKTSTDCSIYTRTVSVVSNSYLGTITHDGLLESYGNYGAGTWQYSFTLSKDAMFAAFFMDPESDQYYKIRLERYYGGEGQYEVLYKGESFYYLPLTPGFYVMTIIWESGDYPAGEFIFGFTDIY